MKRLALIGLMLLALTSCDPAEITQIIQEQEAEQAPIVGMWEKNLYVWEIYPDGEFIYYDMLTNELFNYGFYIDDGDTIYFEDYTNGESATYLYTILNDYPTAGDTTLRWAPEVAPANLVDYLLIGIFE